MELILIAALGSGNHVIGRDGGLPWHIPDEYELFLDHVRDQTVIMGRHSWEIFGDDLTAAHNVVLTRSPEKVRNAAAAPDWPTALERAESRARSSNPPRIFVAGGESVYRLALPYADAMYLSFVKGRHEGDAFFPDFDLGEWTVEEVREHPAFEFVVYGRKAVA